jgi:hypothetical protein
MAAELPRKAAVGTKPISANMSDDNVFRHVAFTELNADGARK